MNKEIKNYLENELAYYTKELKTQLEKLEYLIVAYTEKDLTVAECYKQIIYLAEKKRKLIQLLKTEEN